jgi:hypothetical protein
MKTKHQKIQSGLQATGAWIPEALGRGIPHPFESTLDEIIEYNQDRIRLIYEHLGDVGLGSPDPYPSVVVPQHDGRVICATAFGASYPRWDSLSGSFWLDDKEHVWEGITLEELESLPIPDWSQNKLVQENIQKWNEVKSIVGEEQAPYLPLPWTELIWTLPRTDQSYYFWVFSTFLDLGSFLMGSNDFLIALASDPELAEALVKKIFEISASYSDYMCIIYDRPCIGWGSMGGDNSCLVSADMYRQYAMAFDRLVTEKCGNSPCNLHSCGDSRHLYEVFGEYPDKDRIVLMQTRAVPGLMKKLRKSLPNTYIQLTIHQPQIDFERESPSNIKELVWQFAEDLDFRDMSIDVIFSTVDDQCKANIMAFREAIDEVNAAEYEDNKL